MVGRRADDEKGWERGRDPGPHPMWAAGGRVEKEDPSQEKQARVVLPLPRGVPETPRLSRGAGRGD